MNRKIHSVLAILALLLGSAIAFAHNGVEHVMGAITAITDTSITVETVKHASVSVLIDPATTFTNNEASAARNDLKVGQRVAINAKPNAAKKLVAAGVKWAAPAAGNGDQAGYKK